MLGFQVVWTLLPSNIIKWVMQRQKCYQNLILQPDSSALHLNLVSLQDASLLLFFSSISYQWYIMSGFLVALYLAFDNLVACLRLAFVFFKKITDSVNSRSTFYFFIFKSMQNHCDGYWQPRNFAQYPANHVSSMKTLLSPNQQYTDKPHAFRFPKILCCYLSVLYLLLFLLPTEELILVHSILVKDHHKRFLKYTKNCLKPNIIKCNLEYLPNLTK